MSERRQKRKYPVIPGLTVGARDAPRESSRDYAREGARDDLQGEIDLLRGLLRRIQAEPLEGAELKDLLRILEVAGRTSTRLAALLKAQQEMAGKEDDGSGRIIAGILAGMVADMEKEKASHG